ncbi:ParB-like nuclease domain protein [Gordonia phage LittleMunchkin]|nr:ParB-like nuclease domain protein [Gordonia phage LittleMunchkin]
MASRTAPKPGTTSKVSVSDLALHHNNARKGNVDLIRTSLLAHGQYRPIVANIGTHTGRPMEVLVGNHTLKAARDLASDPEVGADWSTVLVHWVDVDDDEATRILLVDNKSSDESAYDQRALFELIDSLGGDLDGTGFTDEDLSDLEALVQETDLTGLDTDPFSTGDDNHPPAGPKEDDGLINTKDVDEQRESYADAATRLIILTLPIARFVWAQEQLAKYRATHDLASNTDALIHLLETETGEDAPAVDEQVTEAAVTAAEEIAP